MTQRSELKKSLLFGVAVLLAQQRGRFGFSVFFGGVVRVLRGGPVRVVGSGGVRMVWGCGGILQSGVFCEALGSVYIILIGSWASFLSAAGGGAHLYVFWSDEREAYKLVSGPHSRQPCQILLGLWHQQSVKFTELVFQSDQTVFIHIMQKHWNRAVFQLFWQDYILIMNNFEGHTLAPLLFDLQQRTLVLL